MFYFLWTIFNSIAFNVYNFSFEDVIKADEDLNNSKIYLEPGNHLIHFSTINGIFYKELSKITIKDSNIYYAP